MASTSLDRLPTEVLSEIVAIYLDVDNKIIVITQICRRIRQVVFGLGSIWRTIRLISTEYSVGPQYRYKDVRALIYEESIHLIIS
jgi:hypothetical protein